MTVLKPVPHGIEASKSRMKDLGLSRHPFFKPHLFHSGNQGGRLNADQRCGPPFPVDLPVAFLKGLPRVHPFQFPDLRLRQNIAGIRGIVYPGNPRAFPCVFTGYVKGEPACFGEDNGSNPGVYG